ncbi:MAG: phage gp6-like head-tail connector protein [Microbacteriaceae bacterium]|nr:phage gp6-like head-tail connector protein [Microbacteriaceae bacterium]NBS62274.1 phage gp6-like head-tail connector protein [Microbacteriaceae bacterium]
MAIVNGYATRNQIKAALRIGTADTQDDELIDNCAGAASRLIDGYANRAFWVVGTATSRVFTAGSDFVCQVDDMSSTAITVKSSQQANQIFDTTWTTSDYQLEPVNGILDGLTVPYTRIRAIGDYLWPTLNNNFGEEALVQVTALWGWPAVPEPITQATIIQASRIFKRYDSPLGVAGFGDLGVMRVSRALDPDVMQLVEPYRKMRMFA